MSHQPKHEPIYLPPALNCLLLRELIAPTRQASLADLLGQVARSFTATLAPEALKCFNGRLERGLELARNGAVVRFADPEHPRRFKVRSSDGTQFYTVDLDARTCECPDSYKGHTCKHRIAAYYIEQAQKLKQQTEQTYVPQTRIPLTTIRPTCSVPPPREPEFKPTCTVPPTKAEFEKAEKRAQPEAMAKSAPARTEAEILAELGFAPKKPEVKEQPPKSGKLYRRYLHGSDLANQSFLVTIQDVTKEKVMPHPSLPITEKWCLWISSLPQGLPTGVLFGTRGEEDLTAIFGEVSVETLKGRKLVIYPKPISVGGQAKISIRFRGVQ